MLHTLAAGQKYGVWRDATRPRDCPRMGAVPFVLLTLAEGNPGTVPVRGQSLNKTAGSGRQPGDFLCWSKESHGKKGPVTLRWACLARGGLASMRVAAWGLPIMVPFSLAAYQPGTAPVRGQSPSSVTGTGSAGACPFEVRGEKCVVRGVKWQKHKLSLAADQPGTAPVRGQSPSSVTGTGSAGACPFEVRGEKCVVGGVKWQNHKLSLAADQPGTAP